MLKFVYLPNFRYNVTVFFFLKYPMPFVVLCVKLLFSVTNGTTT